MNAAPLLLTQATTALSDGRIFVIGGSWTGGLGGKNAEVYTDGAGWRLLPGCDGLAATLSCRGTDVSGQRHGQVRAGVSVLGCLRCSLSVSVINLSLSA